MSIRLEGKVALVTGAASGTGLAIADLFAREGAKVIMTDINDQGCIRAASAIEGDVLPLKLDVSREDDWQDLARQIEQRFGLLDILINNAGIVLIASVENTTLDQFRKVLDVNAGGVFLGCKTMLPLLKKSSHASIVNVASTASHQGFGLGFAYGASKGAVRTMTKSVAAYCQDQGYHIRCNSIHPNEIETPMMENVMNRIGEHRPVAEGVLPPGSLGAPKDVAYAALYLASEESRFTNGAEMTVDNGSLMRPWASSIVNS